MTKLQPADSSSGPSHAQGVGSCSLHDFCMLYKAIGKAAAIASDACVRTLQIFFLQSKHSTTYLRRLLDDRQDLRYSIFPR